MKFEILRNFSRIGLVALVLAAASTASVSAQSNNNARLTVTPLRNGGTRDDTDWGWLGLLGLVGLAALSRRKAGRGKSYKDTQADRGPAPRPVDRETLSGEGQE